MRTSLTSLVRLVGFVSLAVSALAVGVSRAVPEVPAFLTPESPRYFGLNGSAFLPPASQSYVLDAGTGDLTDAPTSGDDDRIDYLTCSPWTTDPGRFEFIGRTLNREGGAANALCVGVGLTWIGPSGERSIRGRLDLSPTVAGRPCWLPGKPTTLLLSGGDGFLYRQELWDEATASWPPADPETEGFSNDRTIVGWAREPLGDGPPLISDPICPPIPALRGKVFVTICRMIKVGTRLTYSGPEIWWLELDQDISTVIAAGRLIEEREGTSAVDPFDGERMPNLSVTADGQIVIAFLGRLEGSPKHRLAIAPVSVDPKTGRPMVNPTEVRELARDVAATTPPLSPDGRWVFAIHRECSGRPSIERLSVLGLLNDPSATALRLATRGADVEPRP